jgi:hypothetical protein
MSRPRGRPAVLSYFDVTFHFLLRAEFLDRYPSHESGNNRAYAGSLTPVPPTEEAATIRVGTDLYVTCMVGTGRFVVACGHAVKLLGLAHQLLNFIALRVAFQAYELGYAAVAHCIIAPQVEGIVARRCIKLCTNRAAFRVALTLVRHVSGSV